MLSFGLELEILISGRGAALLQGVDAIQHIILLCCKARLVQNT